jgi:hypothetical protein
MEGTRWERVKQIVERAEELPPPEADRYVAAQCAGDPAMLDEVRSLLKYATGGAGGATEVLRIQPGILLDGRYRVIRRLGQGGFGETWIAEDLQLFKRPCVIKIPALRDGADPWIPRKFQEEIKALSDLDHPGIVKPRGSGTLDDGTPFLVMDFVDGQTLRQLMRSGRLTTARVAAIVQQMGRALEAMQARMVYHRDLKPENVMVQTLADGTDRAFIIDFGIASIRDAPDAAQVATRVVGSPNYMAPEQFRGEVGPATDVYAFAVIAREMMATLIDDGGKAPADGAHANPLQPPPLPARWSAPLAGALASDPNHRRTDVGALADEIAAALTAVEPRRSSGAWALAAGVALVALAAAGLTLSNRPGGERPPPPEPIEVAPVHHAVTIELVRKAEPATVWAVDRLPVVLHADDEFRLRVSPATSGHLYIFGEGPDGALTIVFPSVTANRGSSVVLQGHTVHVPEETWLYIKSPSENRLWLVWSRDPQDVMEQARSAATPGGGGAITSADHRRQIIGLLRAAENRVRLEDGRLLLDGADPVLVGVVGVRQVP